MVDREKVLAVLAKRFPSATRQDTAAAANAIVGLDDEWEDVTDRGDELGLNSPAPCCVVCSRARQVERGDTFRVFRRPALRRR